MEGFRLSVVLFSFFFRVSRLQASAVVSAIRWRLPAPVPSHRDVGSQVVSRAPPRTVSAGPQTGSPSLERICSSAMPSLARVRLLSAGVHALLGTAEPHQPWKARSAWSGRLGNGFVDGSISDPASCRIDRYTVVGTAAHCAAASPRQPRQLRKPPRTGARASKGSCSRRVVDREADLTGERGLAPMRSGPSVAPVLAHPSASVRTG